MNPSELKKLYRANNKNIDTIKALFDKAETMQNSIPNLKDDDDRKIMESQFKDVAGAINRLMDNAAKMNELISDIESE